MFCLHILNECEKLQFSSYSSEHGNGTIQKLIWFMHIQSSKQQLEIREIFLHKMYMLHYQHRYKKLITRIF